MRNVIVLVFFVTCVYALTDEEIKAELAKLIVKCTAQHPVEVTDLFQLQKLKLPKKPEVYCLLACAYRKQGVLNEKGLYDIEQAYKLAEVAKNGDEQRLENGKKLADLCAKANEVEVSDGEKGCERSALLFQCVVGNAEKFGFKV